MADQSDVETALVTLASAALYPSGTQAASVPGVDCRVYRGWPNAAALDADLRAGVVNVTVFPGQGGRVTTRYQQQWAASPTPATLTALASGLSVSFGGSADLGQLAGILVDQRTYAYRTQLGDTPAAVAANLATQVRADQIVLLSGAMLTVPGAGRLLARVVADASARMEIRRQVQTFRVTCWCPTPANRDTTAVAIDQALAGMPFIDLSDGTQGRLTYAGTTVFDQSQDALLYRRDLIYSVEYATTLSANQPAMLFGQIDINAATVPA
ncbi:MAG: hypothetical protein JOY66_08095 [Acetobacteraceae bacterium]|nr:hypothetical protein [Acetobacteraceae bacterium]